MIAGVVRRNLQCAAALGLVFAVSACTDPYSPGQRAAGGALIGAGGGAALGAAIGGGPGALTGALVGGGVGAATGVITTPQRPQPQSQPYYPPPPPPP
jgi:hypothetical protein